MGGFALCCGSCGSPCSTRRCCLLPREMGFLNVLMHAGSARCQVLR